MNILIDKVVVKGRYRKALGDLSSLKTSIEELGLLHSIVIDSNNNLVCGQRRLEACKQLGWTEIPCRVIDLEAVIYGERDENMCREDFLPSESVAIAEAVEKHEKEKAKERQREAGRIHGKGQIASVNLTEAIKKTSEREAKAQAAKAVGMSRNTLKKAQEVVKASADAPEKHGDLVEKMDKTGKVSQAHKELSRRKEADRAKEAASGIDDKAIIVGDIQEVGSQIADGSVSLIFTDPPYSKESIDLYDSLGAFAARTLKEGGSLMCFVGQYAVPEVLQRLSRHLKYWWVVCCKHEGASARLYGWHVRVAWKPILWFVKGSLPSEYPMVTDFIKSAVPDKTGHKWAQSIEEAKYYIEHLTYEGELVCDPFLGGGTTCIAAKSLERKYIGIEKDADQAEIAKGRINGSTSET